MPLFEKARIEIYIPDLPARRGYQELLDTLDREFTYTFGVCTILRGLDGSYLSRQGLRTQDRINLIYTDTPFAFEDNFAKIATFTDELRAAAFEALEEESALVEAFKAYHSE